MSATIDGIYIECKTETGAAIDHAKAIARDPHMTAKDLGTLIVHHTNQAASGIEFDLNVFLADLYSAQRERRFEDA